MGKKKQPEPDNAFSQDFDQWMDSDEGEASLEAVEAVQDALDGATIDLKRRRIVWTDGKALTIKKTALRIQTEYELDDLDPVLSHVIGWLEMCDPPPELGEDELDDFEAAVAVWINDFKDES